MLCSSHIIAAINKFSRLLFYSLKRNINDSAQWFLLIEFTVHPRVNPNALSTLYSCILKVSILGFETEKIRIEVFGEEKIEVFSLTVALKTVELWVIAQRPRVRNYNSSFSL
jgi:hypothetical protein